MDGVLSSEYQLFQNPFLSVPREPPEEGWYTKDGQQRYLKSRGCREDSCTIRKEILICPNCLLEPHPTSPK